MPILTNVLYLTPVDPVPSAQTLRAVIAAIALLVLMVTPALHKVVLTTTNALDHHAAETLSAQILPAVLNVSVRKDETVIPWTPVLISTNALHCKTRALHMHYARTQLPVTYASASKVSELNQTQKFYVNRLT